MEVGMSNYTNEYLAISLLVGKAKNFVFDKERIDKKEKQLNIDKKEIMSRIEEIKEKNDENFYKEKIGALREKVNI